MNASQTLRTIAELMTDDGSNPEYDRACIEIACDLLGVPMDSRGEVESILRAVRS
jgi:hypothetical protein